MNGNTRFKWHAHRRRRPAAGAAWVLAPRVAAGSLESAEPQRRGHAQARLPGDLVREVRLAAARALASLPAARRAAHEPVFGTALAEYEAARGVSPDPPRACPNLKVVQALAIFHAKGNECRQLPIGPSA